MKMIIFSACLIAIGFFIGFGPMWGTYNEYRKGIEDAPLAHGFNMISATVERLDQQNTQPDLGLIIKGLKKQSDSMDDYFTSLKENRIGKQNHLLVYGGGLVPLLGIIAYLTRPNKITPNQREDL